MQMKKVWSMILVAAMLLSCIPGGILSVSANATAENVYEDGYTWAFDQTVTFGKTKGLVSGNAAGSIKVMNHEGNDTLTPNRAIADGVLTTEVVKDWGNTVGHGVFYQLPAALETGKHYGLSLNLYGGNDAAAMNGITVSFDTYEETMTGAGGSIQQWQDGGIAGLHNVDAKLTHSISGNLPTAADNTVEIEFVATDAMTSGGWMLVSFPLTLNGSYKLGNASIREVNYAVGYSWKFDKTVEAFTTATEFKKLYYGNKANTVGIINHEVNANYGPRTLKNGILSTVVTAGWNKAAHGVYYKLPLDLVVGQEYVVCMNLYASAEGTPIANNKTTALKLSFVNAPTTTQEWLATGMEAYHNADTLVTYRAPDYLSTDTANELAVTFVATQAMADNDGWMLITFPLETGKAVNLGTTTLKEKKDTDNHFLNGDFSEGLTGWMTNYDSSYISVEDSVLHASDKVPTGDVKLYQAMYLDAGKYRLSFDVFGAPQSWRPVYFMGTALDNSSVTGSQLQLSKEDGKTDNAWWTVTRDVIIATAGTYYFQINLNQVSGSAAVAPSMQYDNFALCKNDKVTITWKNDDGTVLKEDVVTIGTIPEYNGQVPTKAANGHNSYTFAGWDQEVVAAEADTTYTAKYEMTTSEHSYGDSGVCTVCGEAAVSVEKWNIVLGDHIGLNFILKLHPDAQVQVNVDGKQVPVELTENQDGTYQVFIKVAAAQMTSEIQIVVNGQPMEKTYSVRAYADVILSGDYNNYVKNLVKNMLVYGGAAQHYFDLNTEDLANDGIAVDAVTVPGDDLSVEIQDGLDGIDCYAATLSLHSKIAARFYFTAKSVEGLSFTVNGNDYDPVKSNDMYYVEVAGINPYQLDDVLNMVVSDDANALTVSYSPMIYITRMYHKAGSSEQLKALVKAMYGYYLAVEKIVPQISYQDQRFSFAGFWEENQNGELVSYKRVAMTTIRFQGTEIFVSARLDGTAKWYMDDVLVEPTVMDGGFRFCVPEGEHRLKAVLVSPSQMYLQGAQTDGMFLDDEARPNVQFIGDSITHAYPGYAAATGEALGVDYSVVAHPGMSLVDGWGWYTLGEGATERIGMESNYFQLETPDVASEFTPHSFTYDRKPDAIVIYLGVNDYLTEGSNFNEENPEIFAQKYVAFVQQLRQLYPDAPVVIVQCHLPDRQIRIDAIADAYARMAQVMDHVYLADASLWNVAVSSDNVHPSAAGYSQMAAKMTEFLKTIIGE